MDQDKNHNTEITVADPNESFHDALMQFTDEEEEEHKEEEHKE